MQAKAFHTGPRAPRTERLAYMIRLSADEREMLRKLSAKYKITAANVIRILISNASKGH